MKLTTTKISIPVLMLMMFQSGHSMEAWFGRALCLAAKGQTAQAVRIVHQHDPNFFEVTNPAQVDPEVMAIINGTDGGQNVAPADDQGGSSDVTPDPQEQIDAWWASIMESVDEYTPRNLIGDEGFADSVQDSFEGLMVGDDPVTAAQVKTAFRDTIFENFKTADWWKEDRSIYDDLGVWETGIATAWKNSFVPPVETQIDGETSKDKIDEDLLGADASSPGTIRKFISEYNADTEEDVKKSHLAEFLEARTLTALGAMVEGETPTPNEALDATYTTIANAITAAGDDGAADGYVEGTKKHEVAVYEALKSRADGLHNTALQAQIGGTGITVAGAVLDAIRNAVDEAVGEEAQKAAAEETLIDSSADIVTNANAENRETALRNYLKANFGRKPDEAPEGVIESLLNKTYEGEDPQAKRDRLNDAVYDELFKDTFGFLSYDDVLVTNEGWVDDLDESYAAVKAAGDNEDALQAAWDGVKGLIRYDIETFTNRTANQIADLLNNIKEQTPPNND